MPTADTSPPRAANPFAAQIVQEADSHSDLVDVSSLHESARSTLLRGRARAQAGLPYLAVLVGEEGAGKSHLLWWLRRQRQAETGLFVSMAALPDLAQPFRHALRQLIGALCRKEPGDITGRIFERYIDRLMWEVLYTQCSDLLDSARIGMFQGPGSLLKLVEPLCLDGGSRRSIAAFAIAAEPLWPQIEPGLRAHLLSLPTEGSIDSAARAVLLQYPYADRKALCTAWLAGEELSAKDRERIGAKQFINNESVAKYVLCALCRMLTAISARTPHQARAALTLVYDHVDSVAQQLGLAGAQSIAEVISTVQQQGGATFQILSCRPDTWQMITEKPTRPAPGQLKQLDDVIELGRPATQHLSELLNARAKATSLLSSTDLEPGRWPANLLTPRAVLVHFSAIFMTRSDALRKDSVPVYTTDVPTAKGMPSNPVKMQAQSARNVPSRPAVLLNSAKITPTPGRGSPSLPLGKKDTGSKPGALLSPLKKDTGSRPPTAKKEPDAAPIASEPSAASPSASWMAMASDDELSSVLGSAGDAPPAKDAADKSAVPKSASKASMAPAAPAKPTEVIQPPPPAEPSAQSPSVTWMAMASDDDPLAKALAAVAAEDEAAASQEANSRRR